MIEVFSDRVEIYNPGGLPSGLDPKDFGTKSVPRNLRIASMLHRANYIEQAGTGIGRIKKALANHKKKVKLDIRYSNDSIFYSVIFSKKGLVENQVKILELIFTNPKVSKRVMAKTIGVSTTTIDKNINVLKKKGFIKRIGSDKGGYWKVIKKNKKKDF